MMFAFILISWVVVAFAVMLAIAVLAGAFIAAGAAVRDERNNRTAMRKGRAEGAVMTYSIRPVGDGMVALFRDGHHCADFWRVELAPVVMALVAEISDDANVPQHRVMSSGKPWGGPL